MGHPTRSRSTSQPHMLYLHASAGLSDLSAGQYSIVIFNCNGCTNSFLPLQAGSKAR